MQKIVFPAVLGLWLPIGLAVAQTSSQSENPLFLGDVIKTMSQQEISQMQDTGSLSIDMDISIQAAIDDAIAQGVIGADDADDADDAAATLSLVSANAEFFNFDILDAIGSVIEDGTFSMDQVRQTLEGFNNLSDEGKALVGDRQFDVADTSDGSLFNQLSDADKSIVLNSMPVVGAPTQ